MRTVGVEEELLLVDGEVGRPRAMAEQVVRRSEGAEEEGGSVGHELQQQQVEIDTPPRTGMAEVESELRSARDTAIAEARALGARVVASGTSPQPVEPRLVREARYDEVAEHYGATAHEQLACGAHVHVGVESDEEGVAVLDRIRAWLPVVAALSANSPFHRGVDTGYASFRSQLMARWPTAGPYALFGSAEAYHALVDTLVGTGVPLDPGMVYFDARLAQSYPTVEIRVADVCADVRETVLVAALCRALVDTAAGAWSGGEPASDVPVAVLRAAAWQAGRQGLEGGLLDPVTWRPRPAREVVGALVDHLRPALLANGDETMVEQEVARLLERGSGAARQRAVLDRTGQLSDVVADLARVTAGLAD